MTHSRKCAVLISIVLALWCEGCAWVVSPSTRTEWVDRLAAAEGTINTQRERIETAGNAARDNQLGFIDDIHGLRPSDGTADLDADFSRSEVLKWSKSQSDATDRISDVEQDLALLRDEIEGGGW